MKNTIIIVAALALGFIVQGCQTTRTTFQDTSDVGYDRLTVTWTSGHKSQIFVRVFERSGHMAFCSYVLSERPLSDQEIETTYFGVNTLFVDGESVGNGSFIPIYSHDASGPYRAGCVETTVAWRNSLADGDITMDNSRRIIMKY